MPRRLIRPSLRLMVGLLTGYVMTGLDRPAGADQVVLKTGQVLQGEIDRDNAIVSVFDGLKRTVVRDTKIERIDPEPPGARQQPERFTLIQPLERHGGSMPSHALGIQTTPWDAAGQRLFSYSYFTSPSARKVVRMKQAINELGPDYVKYRGIDGFWIGLLNTSQVPKEVVLGLLGQVDQTEQNERLRVGRFLIQAKWYPEARAELDRLALDFPELKDTVESVRSMVIDLEARQLLTEADQQVASRQPNLARSMLRTFPRAGVSQSLLTEIDDRVRAIDETNRRAKDLSADLRQLIDSQSPTIAAAWKDRTFEIFQTLASAPEVAIERLQPFHEASRENTEEQKLALAVSAWVLGPERAVADLNTADGLWSVRERIAAYLANEDESERARILEELRKTTLPDIEPGAFRAPTLDEATWLTRYLPPPRADRDPQAGVPLIRRVLDDPNPTPTEYTVLLPPEYQPLRSYPAVVALHDGRGTATAIERWGPEAQRNGYILIAPEYLAPGDRSTYQYSTDEHAAVQLAIRDARKRYAIDSDRVFLVGALMGGDAAWDIGLAHPDLFAGVAPVSGLPAKYVAKTRDHVEYVPLYVTIGDLATAATEALVFESVKSMISKTWDVTYAEYSRRGLEDLPEETPAIFDWMNRRHRSPYRKEFQANACRPGDDRFFGVVIRAFSPGRAVPPQVVDPLGRELKPATLELKTSTAANLMSLTVSGVDALDLWLPPEGFRYDEKLQVRVNGRRLFQDTVKPDLGAFLEDIRLRGDRQQVYYARISLGGKS